MRAVKRTENKFLRAVLKILGILFVGLGILGIIFPVLPATPNFLIAAWCFMKSSDRLYHWLMTNRIFGKYLRNYTEGKGIPILLKAFLLTFLWLMIFYAIMYLFENIYIRIILFIISVIITIHILMIKTYKKKKNEIY